MRNLIYLIIGLFSTAALVFSILFALVAYTKITRYFSSKRIKPL